mmetsp:Transcript_140/g.324  ORF Transcript_140/g.324 Transcript_140/m.324 type:complete len:261 (-) Transcript_140:445-1227(-)
MFVIESVLPHMVAVWILVHHLRSSPPLWARSTSSSHHVLEDVGPCVGPLPLEPSAVILHKVEGIESLLHVVRLLIDVVILLPISVLEWIFLEHLLETVEDRALSLVHLIHALMLTLSLQVADIPSLTVLQDAVVDAVGHVKVVGTLVEEEELLVLRAGACMKGPSSRARRLPVEELLEDVEGVKALKALEACLTALHVFHVAEGIILLPLLLIAENLVGLGCCDEVLLCAILVRSGVLVGVVLQAELSVRSLDLLIVCIP